MESRYLVEITDEAIKIDIDYNKDTLMSLYNSLAKTHIDNIKLNHLDEFNKNFNSDITADTIAGFKKQLNKKTHHRKDIVSPILCSNSEIENIINQLQKKLNQKAIIGDVSFFLQKANEDIPLHSDYPYRKNSLLNIPLQGTSSSITYFLDGKSYFIDGPTILNVMKPHGVKNITEDRLCLHIEIPNLSIEEIGKLLNEKNNTK